MYTYRAVITRVVDGDTVHAHVDMGCDLSLEMTLRLAHINAPEISTDLGKLSKASLISMLPEDMHVIVRTIKDKKEKYGRYLAELYDWSETQFDLHHSFNQRMIDVGMAAEYEGGAR